MTISKLKNSNSSRTPFSSRGEPTNQSSGHAVRLLERGGATKGFLTPLNAAERSALKRCERTIRKGAVQFIAVGLALKEIKDRQLYRETHSSFEEYCIDRFGFKRAHGYRLIEQAAAVVELQELSPNGDTPLPLNEGQARELAAVMAEMRGEVMRLAASKAGERPLTAKIIREAAVELGVSKAASGKLIPNGGDDCVNTPDWLAQGIVQHFMPSGRVLDPCRGAGAFFRAFPRHCTTGWCEIQEGLDFFETDDRWDWIIGNPPYSDFRRFLIKSMQISDNIVFLALANAWFVRARQGDIKSAGFGLVELCEVPVPETDWPKFGMTLVAAWLRRRWAGGIAYTRLSAEQILNTEPQTC